MVSILLKLLHWSTRTSLHVRGLVMCAAVLVMLVSLESLATISCDRMMGVVRPFHTHLKTWQSLAIIIVIWVSSALLAVPWGLYRVYTVSPLRGHCFCLQCLERGLVIQLFFM